MGASCGGSRGDKALSTTTTSMPPSTTTTAIDVTVVPATIDVAYVQRVFEVLDQIDGVVSQDALRERSISQAMIGRLATIYFPEELDRQVQVLADDVKGDLSVFRSPPGIRHTKVQRLLTASRDCISVEVLFDSSEVVLQPKAQTPTYFGLRPKTPASDPAGLNTTRYSIFSEDKKAVDPCVVP